MKRHEDNGGGKERMDRVNWKKNKIKPTVTKRDSLQLDSFFSAFFCFVLLLFDIHPLNIHNNKFLLIKNTGNHANITLLFLCHRFLSFYQNGFIDLNFLNYRSLHAPDPFSKTHGDPLTPDVTLFVLPKRNHLQNKLGKKNSHTFFFFIQNSQMRHCNPRNISASHKSPFC